MAIQLFFAGGDAKRSRQTSSSLSTKERSIIHFHNPAQAPTPARSLPDLGAGGWRAETLGRPFLTRSGETRPDCPPVLRGAAGISSSGRYVSRG